MAQKRIDPRKVPVNPARASSGSGKKIFGWLLAIAIFYVLTAAAVSSSVQEVTKNIEQRYAVQEPYVVEKVVKTTKYRTEKTPYGTPRCEQMNYNFSYTYQYSEKLTDDGNKLGTCTYNVKNQEDIAGDFKFYVQFFKNGAVSDGPDQMKRIEALSITPFTWDIKVGATDSLTCLLQANGPPHRMKCFYLEPVTYQIKQVPYTVEELKNVTEYRNVEKSKVVAQTTNETVKTYTNKYFGYSQFFYFGY